MRAEVMKSIFNISFLLGIWTAGECFSSVHIDARCLSEETIDSCPYILIEYFCVTNISQLCDEDIFADEDG